MQKVKCSITVDSGTLDLIQKAAKLNGLSRSAVIRMLIQTICYIPLEKLKETSPVVHILGLRE